MLRPAPPLALRILRLTCRKRLPVWARSSPGQRSAYRSFGAYGSRSRRLSPSSNSRTSRNHRPRGSPARGRGTAVIYMRGTYLEFGPTSWGLAQSCCQNLLMWHSGVFHGPVMRRPSRIAIILIRKFTELRSSPKETTNERVAETRDHRVRGWHGSHELSPGRARPRLISRIDLTTLRKMAVPAKLGAAIFVLGWPV